MGYHQCASEKADYTFIAVNHFWSPIQLSLFDTVDAVVTESVPHGFTTIPADSRAEKAICTAGRYGRSELVEKCREGSFGLFNAGVDMDWSQFVNAAGKTPDQLMVEGTQAYNLQLAREGKVDFTIRTFYHGLRYTFLGGRIPNDVVDYTTDLSVQQKLPLSTGRSVVIAEKCEEGLVGLLQGRLKKKRPHIGLIFGIRHIDMISFLNHPELRQEVLHHYAGNNYKPFETSTLNRVLEYHFVNDKENSYWNVRRFTLPVFDRKDRRKNHRKRR